VKRSGAAALAAALLWVEIPASADISLNPAESLLAAEPGLTILEQTRSDNGATQFWLSLLDGTSFCTDADGSGTHAYVLEGAWNDDGTWRPSGFSVACAGGAHAKCIENGFLPWEGRHAQDMHLSCVRMVRADYCGDGQATTVPGVRIRFEPAGTYQPGARTEAGWSPHGAVVVFRTRTPEGAAHIGEACPDLLDRSAPWSEVLLWNE